MKQVLTFFKELNKNNNKPWFDAHKSEYIEVQTIFNDFVKQLIESISAFDSSVSNLTVKDCTYRIYRDLRFSNDKRPYKNHIGAFIAPGGKCSGHAGYYFHIEPQEGDYLSNNMLCGGVYMLQPAALKSIREEIMLNGEEFDRVVKGAGDFFLDGGSMLKKVPGGFDASYKYAEYYKYKSFTLMKIVDDNYILADNLLERVVDDFKKTTRFNFVLNQAIDYSLEK